MRTSQKAQMLTLTLTTIRGSNYKGTIMNQEQQLNQALRLTVNELTAQLANESTTKNLLAIQLTEVDQEKQQLTQQNAELQARVSELEGLLDEQTQPEIIEGE